MKPVQSLHINSRGLPILLKAEWQTLGTTQTGN